MRIEDFDPRTASVKDLEAALLEMALTDPLVHRLFTLRATGARDAPIDPAVFYAWMAMHLANALREQRKINIDLAHNTARPMKFSAT